MRTETVEVRIGENVGPVDWTHPLAKDMPPIWREAEKNPAGFTFSEYRRPIIAICMYGYSDLSVENAQPCAII